MSLAEIGDFIILALSRDPAVTARTGDGDTMGTRAKTTSAFYVLKSCSVFLDVKAQHRFFFFKSSCSQGMNSSVEHQESTFIYLTNCNSLKF